MSFVDEGQDKQIKSESLGDGKVEYVTQPDIDHPWKEKEGDWVFGKLFTHEPHAITASPQGVLKQLWHLNRVWDFFNENDEAHTFDVVVRLRPDLWFHEPVPVRVANRGECYLPNWGSFGGYNDRFAIMHNNVAAHYFGAFNRLEPLFQAGCPLHTESILRASLDAWAVNVVKVPFVFSTLRENGEMRWPEMYFDQFIGNK